MAPKTRSGKVLGTVVMKKVVKETVQVVVSPGEEGNGEDEDERMEVVSETIKENEKVEVISSSAKRSPVKVVVVGDKAEEEDQRPPQEQPEQGPEQPQQEQENQEDEQLKQQQQEEEQRPQPQPQQEEEQAEAVLQQEKGKEQEEEEGEKSEAEDEETKPASQPEVTPAPAPPKFEQPPRKEEEERGKKRKPKEEKAVEDDQKKKTTQKGGGVKEGGKRMKKRAKVGGGGGEEYKRYVFRVMKQVHPDMGISSKAMTVINNLMSDMFERIADEASKLSRYIGRATLSSMEIQDAVKLVLPGDLGKHAIAEGSKAVTNYVASVTGDPKFKTKTKS